MSYNRVILMGNITRDVELRAIPNGTSIAQIGLAVNRKWKDKDGVQQEEVTYIDCEAWGKTAENIARFFSKGKPIFIEGRLKLDTWKDKTDGSNRSKLKVVVDTFEFVGGKTDDAPQGARPAASKPATRAAVPTAVGEEISPDDIPF